MSRISFPAVALSGLFAATAAFAQVPEGVRSLQLQRDQQQGENALRSQQFRREAQSPAQSPAEIRDRAALDRDQRLRQQQLHQQQQLDLSVKGAGSRPNAEARRQSELRQLDSDRQRQLRRFEAERTLQNAAHR